MAAQLDQSSMTDLPAWKYWPGQTESADHTLLDTAKASVPAQFLNHVPLDHAAFQYGLMLHDNGFFWEAHEVWEAVWIAAPKNGRDRIALRALIQIANAGLKVLLGKDNARDRLIAEAIALLNELNMRGSRSIAFSPADTLDINALILVLNEWNESGKSKLKYQVNSRSKIQLSNYFAEITPTEKLQNNS